MKERIRRVWHYSILMCYKLIEYIACGPISNKRLQITKAGLVKLEIKTASSNGTTHLLFAKGEFLEKLAALIPPRRAHLVRWSGVFSSNSPMRRKILLKPEIKKGFQFRDDKDTGSERPPSPSAYLRCLLLPKSQHSRGP